MKVRLLHAAASLLASLLLVSCGGGSNTASPEVVSSAARKQALAVPAVTAPILSATWTQLPNPQYAPPDGPYVRQWTEMLWDPILQQIVIFGGNGAHEYENDIWSWNGTSGLWTNIQPYSFCPGNTGFSRPNGSDDTAFKYDPVNNLYWIFGIPSGYRCQAFLTSRQAGAGTTTSSIIDSSLAGTTAADYLNWQVQAGSATVSVTGYDPANKVLSLSAPVSSLGSGSSYYLYATTTIGTWYYDPVTQNWTGQNLPNSNAGVTPTGPRIAPGVDYSTSDNAFAMFAGWGGGVDRSVWKLDVLTKAWSQLPVPPTSPPHLRELLNSFVYDKANDVFILFGGQCADTAGCTANTVYGETWAYKLSTNTWTKMNPPAQPAARAQQVMAYDADNGVVVLFGGVLQDGTVASDTWYYHYPSNTWTQLAAATSPAGRYLAQIAYDPVQKRTVVFGGVNSLGARADIWGLKLTPAPHLPVVSITAPVNGAVQPNSPTSITVSANATETNGTIAKVEFFSNGTRIGESLQAPYSVNWTNVASGTYALTAVATDNNGGSTISASVSVRVNAAPSVGLTSPLTGAAYIEVATVAIAATASDSDGTVAKVEFYANGSKLGEATSAPYSLNWSGVTRGTYTIQAVATDNDGGVTPSAVVSVVVAPPNSPPAVALTAPASGVSFTAPTAVTISASASDSDGNVSKVEFYANGAKLGEATSAPYAMSWSVTTAGSYALTAVATDNLGATTTSATVNVTVSVASGAPVNVALQSNGGVATASSSYSANFPASAVNDGNRLSNKYGAGGVWADATSYSFPDWVQVNFASSQTINRIEVITRPDDTTLTNITSSTTFSSYGITAYSVQYWTGSAWATVSGGNVTGNNLVWRTFTFPAVTTDRIRVVVNGGSQLSYLAEIEAWTVDLSGNTPPAVSLTSPADGSSYTTPVAIALTASASDSNGSVSKVEFYANSTKIGEALSAPYSLSWNVTNPGSYALTAVATDNVGATTTSAAVNITVAAGAGVPVNVALQSNGGVATASSSYSANFPAAAVNDGNRLSNGYGSGGVWADATSYSFPDWVQVNFASSQTINRIEVVTRPDDTTLTNITSSTTFSSYGITAYSVQYWTGSAWATVSGGNVTGNNLVWRTFTFPAVTTDRIRVVVNGGSQLSYLAEIEAWTVDLTGNTPPTVSLTSPASGSSYTTPVSIPLTAAASDANGSVSKVEFYANSTKIGEALSAPYTLSWNVTNPGSYALTAVATDNVGATATSAAVNVTVAAGVGVPLNVALQSNGGVATASSSYSANTPAAAVNDGNRLSDKYGAGGVWADGTSFSFPDWVQVNFANSQTINRIEVFTRPDDTTLTNITPTTTFSNYGITAYAVQYWTGSAWATVSGGNVTGNNLVWRTFTFPAVTTDRIRVVVNGGSQLSYIAEIEAWTP